MFTSCRSFWRNSTKKQSHFSSCLCGNSLLLLWEGRLAEILITMRVLHVHVVVFLLIIHASAILPVTAVKSTQLVKAPPPPPPGGNCSCSSGWTSVLMNFGSVINFQQTGTLTFLVPSVIPSTAREILVYAVVQVGTSGPSASLDYVKIYTRDKSQEYGKYLGFTTYGQGAYSTNSENMWFPLTCDRRLYVRVFNEHSGNIKLSLSAVGYRWLYLVTGLKNAVGLVTCLYLCVCIDYFLLFMYTVMSCHPLLVCTSTPYNYVNDKIDRYTLCILFILVKFVCTCLCEKLISCFVSGSSPLWVDGLLYHNTTIINCAVIMD